MARWRETIIASIVLHVLICAGIFLMLEASERDQKVASSELEWIEIDSLETALPDGLGLETATVESTAAVSTEA